MEPTPAEHQKVLQDLDRLMSEATDEASREEIRRLRDSLNTPQMIEMARAAEKHKEHRKGNPVLEFHDTVIPWYLAASGCVIATAICLYALLLAFEFPVLVVGGRAISPWLIATVAGAVSVAFTALSVMRPFSVRFDTEGMMSRVSGGRWQRLYTGAMAWKNIRSLRERPEDRVLEVRSAGGEVFEIPMRVANYPILRGHLDNMVLLYGERR
ncbi:MAG: hypothetical protein ABI769_07830 [Pseudomonadota bacterium]